MKRIVTFIVILVAACSLCAFVAYRAGVARGRPLEKGAFIVSLDALQKLRGGDIGQATRNMEKLCFSSADMFYRDASYQDRMETKTFIQDLTQYRASYRTNRAEWTATEEQLEKHLASWK
jgi:hypothetical protein